MRFPLSRDGWLLFATCGTGSFGYGFLSVVLGLYLAAVGLSATMIGRDPLNRRQLRGTERVSLVVV